MYRDRVIYYGLVNLPTSLLYFLTIMGLRVRGIGLIASLANLSSSGGVYATLADLRRLGLSILHSELLDSDSTRLWMGPRSFTSALTVALDAPWEINRLPLPL